MKVFVSTGFTKRSEQEVRADLDRARQWTCRRYADGICVHNYECEEPKVIKNFNRVWYLGKAIETLADCDLVYFCKGWENHKGCRIEYDVCKLYMIPMVFED